MIAIAVGYLADLIIGDPYWLPHPIRLMGKAIKGTEKLLRRNCQGIVCEKRRGVLLTCIIVGCTYAIAVLMIKLAYFVHPYAGFSMETFMIFQILATKSLDIESRKVFCQLQKGNIPEARKYLSYIVGRDTTQLDEREIIRAAVETVAENISDGIIAPLFYITIGGAPLGMAYKAVNTLDSMVGYKNEQYRYFGWASAKLDDLVNYIPARLTAVFILAGSFCYRWHWKNCWRILIRDRRNHKSPNSGYPEAAVAGALEIQIGGTNVYFGQKVYKPTIGDSIRPLEKEDIVRTTKLMYGASMIGLIFFLALRHMLFL